MSPDPCRSRGGPRATGALVIFGLLLQAGPWRAAGSKPSPTPPPTAGTDQRWKGMTRRQPGLALGGRWRKGTLTFREETLRWADAKDPGRNLVLPAGRIASHRRVCRDAEDASTCFEWSFRTVDGQSHVFRDDLHASPVGRAGEIFAFFRSVLPAVPAETSTGSP